MKQAWTPTATLAGVSLLLLAGSLALFWPGVVMYDSVAQFTQSVVGEYGDWHPPVMAWLWRMLHHLCDGGAEPMLLLQMGLYWLGFGLIATALARTGRMQPAMAVLGIAVVPLFVGWQGVVLKDTQMLGAVLAACGAVAWWRLRGTKVPLWVVAGVVVLLCYATLVRANAVFATVPLGVLLFARGSGWRRWWVRPVLCLGGIVVALGLAQAVNHAVIGADPSGVERTEAFYDLAAIAVAVPDAPIGYTPAEARALIDLHCVKPFFWDPLGTPERCGPTIERLHGFNAGQLYRWLAEGIVRHPLAYAAHRLRHLNSTDRWLVPANWPSAVPPGVSEPNTLGLASPGAGARGWQSVARWTAETPLGWPIAWIVVALTGVAVAARRRASPLRDIAFALLVSAIALEASFGVLSIASDLRYHLWPMVATALASVLLWSDARWPRRALMIGGGVLALVIVSGTLTRLLLPPPPASYAALLL